MERTEYSQKERDSDTETTLGRVPARAHPEKRSAQRGSADIPPTASESANAALTTFAGQAPGSARGYRIAISHSLRPARVTFNRLEVREGVVLAVVDGSSFRARLVDPRGTQPDEEVEIEIAQLSRSDQRLVATGAFFFWAIGYVTRNSGRRELSLKIEFRRLPSLPPGSEEHALAAARQYMGEMGWT